MARVYFPDGRVLYTPYSTVSCAIHSDLYEDFAAEGQEDGYGGTLDRDRVEGEPLPRFPHQPLSDADDLILVRIEEEPDRDGWSALFCPRQNQIYGPHLSYFAWLMQTELDLVEHAQQLHLTEKGPATLCGQDASGPEVPYHRYEWPGSSAYQPDPPEPRDLYAEWNDGKVCRQCLLKALATHGVEWNRPPPAAAPVEPKLSWFATTLAWLKKA